MYGLLIGTRAVASGGSAYTQWHNVNHARGPAVDGNQHNRDADIDTTLRLPKDLIEGL